MKESYLTMITQVQHENNFILEKDFFVQRTIDD